MIVYLPAINITGKYAHIERNLIEQNRRLRCLLKVSWQDKKQKNDCKEKIIIHGWIPSRTFSAFSLYYKYICTHYYSISIFLLKSTIKFKVVKIAILNGLDDRSAFKNLIASGLIFLFWERLKLTSSYSGIIICLLFGKDFGYALPFQEIYLKILTAAITPKNILEKRICVRRQKISCFSWHCTSFRSSVLIIRGCFST